MSKQFKVKLWQIGMTEAVQRHSLETRRGQRWAGISIQAWYKIQTQSRSNQETEISEVRYRA